MPSTRTLRQNRPLLFSPAVIRQIQEDSLGSNTFHKVDYMALSSSALDSTGSFRYNLPGDGLRSTQQLNIDWSVFENHTFFNSAHVKTNVAFRKIFDQFPFDGSQSEFENFVDSLSGFEKYVYDQFPKNKGYLFLSGTAASETGSEGTYVTIRDVAGVAYPGVSRNLSGKSILNPGLNPMTVEFWSYIPVSGAASSGIFEKVNASTLQGFGALFNSANNKVNFGIFSGSNAILGTEIIVPRGQWNHTAFVWDRTSGVNRVFGYLNGVLVASSSHAYEFGLLDCDSADFLIGSSSVGFGAQTFSGALDEIRIWHTVRTQQERDEYMKKSVFAQENLKLCLKFNEASGSQTPIVLDSSGNSLHGTLSTWAFNNGIREVATGSVAGESPMTYERLENSPILFPLHPDVEELNDTFLSDADEFDQINPNRIDRLVPKHYLLQGQDQDGLSTEEGSIIDGLVINGTTGTGDTAKLGDTQVILMLLYTWAKFFDEMKLYLQAFGNLIHLDYDSTDTIPDSFLQLFAQQYGITLPPLFAGASINQFINAENLDNEISTGTYPLQYIQNQIWRRVLLNLQDVLRSKGTIHSVKTFIRSVGIDPDNNFRIREFGGPTVKALANVRESRSEVSTLIDFSSGSRVQSPFLSGSRLQKELGYPYPSAFSTFVNGVSDNPSDGLFTSGSWTFEGTYRFPSTASLTSATQSLARIHITGSAAPNSASFLVGNLLAVQNGLVYFVVAPNYFGSNTLTLSVPADVFDGGVWNISFGRQRADEIYSSTSSSYFLRAAKQGFGEITDLQVTSAFFDETVGGSNLIVWSNVANGLIAPANASGSFIAIGSESLPASGSRFLNDTSLDGFVRSSAFDGRAGQFRFWSLALSQDEWVEHVRNFKSLGVSNPLANFNFVTNQTGSFGRLRMDVSSDQVELSSSNTGFLQLTDFSQNNLHWSGSFPATSSVIYPQLFQYSLLSPKFDVGATTDKVRVRSFQDFSNVQSSSYAQVAPIYALEPSEVPQDNTRFTIDFSVVDAMDQDIINIFATLDILDNVIGNPELVFSPDYPDLENLRNIYFNRLTGTVNLKSFFEFYKWFDTNIGVFIAQLLPRKTKFLGTNFVIESHMLERPKLEYLYSDIYLGDSTRHALKDTILFQQFVASLVRF
jgi:hypothetical protein